MTGPLLLTEDEMRQLTEQGAMKGRRSRRGLRVPVVEKSPELVVAALRRKLESAGLRIVPALQAARRGHRRVRGYRWYHLVVVWILGWVVGLLHC